MTYNKPEVVKLDSALKAILGVKKFQQLFPDSIHPEQLATAGAYEADE